MEEFQHLLAPDLVSLMKESMYNATVGDGYRVGGFHDDNLYPVYSNPWYMRVMSATYVGNMMKDANMTHWGNVWASEAITEFDRHGTLSEYNSGTYTGVSLYALSLWGYMPKNSTIVSRAPGIITKIWEDVGFFYNPTIHSLGPPWDRAYGYDMQFYFGILGAQITGLVGGISDGTAPIPLPLPAGGHYEDAAVIPLLPLTSKFHDKYVPKSVIAKLTASKSEFHTAQAASPPFEDIANPRNYTMWKQPGLSAGGVQIDGNVVGGAARNPGAFVPASIIWQTGVEGTGVSWLNLYPTSSSISAIATSSNITITYPPSKSFPANASISNIISLAFNGIYGFDFPADFLASGSAEIPGLKLTVETNGNRTKFLYGEATLNDQKYYNLTYTFTGPETPRLVLGFEKV
ncbi:hypothetical protein QCA50_014561 [Cerrena zonata]|uniref:Uncharacterized protein n=1 Tax=Cerrena zonata TaxID=2478898 RepID=A0AAW0FNU1_9APHY